MGHVNEFNWDIGPIVLLDITGAQALRDFMGAVHLYWTLLVAPKIVSVTLSLGLVGLDDLDKAVAIIKDHNKYQYTKVKDGAWLVDRMILGKCWLLQEYTKARTNGEKVFWGRFWGKGNKKG